MTIFYVSVIIENKPGLADPEGDTILKDLILKQNKGNQEENEKNHMVKSVRSAKLLRFEVDAKNNEQAENEVRKICDDLRIYNPVVSRVTIQTSM